MTKNSQENNSEESLNSEKLGKEMDRRTFFKRTSQVAGAAFAITVASSLEAIPVSAVSKSSVMNPNGRKPDLVFPVISDIHIQNTSDRTLNKFIETLNQLNRLVPKQDAFVAVGDVTDHGYEVEYNKLMNAYNQRKQPQAVSMFAIGNHDYWNGMSVSNAQKLFLEKTGMESLYYHKTVKGFHFIVLATEDGVTEGTFNKEQIQWLDRRLRIAHMADSKKPIFVFHHQPIKGTVYGSEWGFNLNRDLFYNTLSKYPQVISFSGHTHYPLDDPRIIHQKDFTAIGTSTGNDLWLEKGRLQGEYPAGGDYLNQALIVEVHNNKVIIKRRDIHNDDWTGEPFELSYPAKTNKFKYTENRDKKSPYFPKGAMVSIDKEKTTLTSLTLMLTQAKDDLLVHDYRITAKNTETKEVEKEYLSFSEFYKDPVPNPLAITINDLKPSTTYEIDVYALDAFENESNYSISTLGKTLEGTINEPIITLSKDILQGVMDKVDVKVDNIRAPQSDWIGLYEANVDPGAANPSIWWMWTPQGTDGAFTFTYDPKNNIYPNRYKENESYKMVYFYGSGYDAVASAVFTVGSKSLVI